jgi:thiamine-phosphate pyrophosphorylase
MQKGILRIVDANFNRCKEGLRVVEDIFRFVIKDDNLRKKVRRLRHSLDCVTEEKFFKEAVLSRNSKKDLGRRIDYLEIKRKDCIDILYINLQRAKESLRVMEEFFKIISSAKVSYIKKMRYEIYSLEKKIILKESSLCNIR